MKAKLFIPSLVLVVFAWSLTTSCQKQTDCKLMVTTVDTAGRPVASAKIKLYANVKTSTGTIVEADLKAEGVSDANGSSSYTFKLPAILDIRATGSTGKVGTGIIKLEEGKTVEKSITVK